jgi:hypothetical protein
MNFRDCSWHADLPANTSSTIIFRCDSFSVGRGQESGRCWGDTVSILSPNNDTLTLCGKRDGIHLTLEGYSESLEIRFKSENNTISHGFSCLVYTEDEKVAEIGEPDFDCKKISLYLLYSNVLINYPFSVCHFLLRLAYLSITVEKISVLVQTRLDIS